jgi:hypothetical protein
MIDAMKQALEALTNRDPHRAKELQNEAITALKQAIKEAEEAEPHYWAYTSKITGAEVVTAQPPDRIIEPEQFYIKSLYTHPAKPWQGLSEEDISDAMTTHHGYETLWVSFARAIEAKLKEKNNGN